LFVVDTATAINGTVSGGQMEMAAAYNADGIHPNDAGNAVLAALINPLIKQAGRSA
jgi:lysophospholipase L1-like esterase